MMKARHFILTLLRCINLFSPPTAGEIFIDGMEITGSRTNGEKAKKRIGMVFQSYNLFNHLTVVENVMLALIKIKKLKRQEAYDIAMKQLEVVGLTHTALKYPDEISGGQKQRVSIARTLAMDPELLLFDEPTSALDPISTREVEAVIHRLAQMGKTMMIVTHELRFAKAVSNRIFYLDKGILYEEGTPQEIFEQPKRERTRAFVKQLRVFRYRFDTGNVSYGDCQEKLKGFLENNALEHCVKLNSFVDALLTVLLPRYMPEPMPVSFLCEYGKETNTLKLLLYFRAKQETVIRDFTEFMEERLTNVTVESIEDEDFNKKLTGELTDFE